MCLQYAPWSWCVQTGPDEFATVHPSLLLRGVPLRVSLRSFWQKIRRGLVFQASGVRLLSQARLLSGVGRRGRMERRARETRRGRRKREGEGLEGLFGREQTITYVADSCTKPHEASHRA